MLRSLNSPLSEETFYEKCVKLHWNTQFSSHSDSLILISLKMILNILWKFMFCNIQICFEKRCKCRSIAASLGLFLNVITQNLIILFMWRFWNWWKYFLYFMFYNLQNHLLFFFCLINIKYDNLNPNPAPVTLIILQKTSLLHITIIGNVGPVQSLLGIIRNLNIQKE